MLPSLQPPDKVHEQSWAPVALEECVHECIRFWDDAFAAWQGINPAEVLTAVQKADMAFKMMQQIRNKLVEAYQEIKEIQI